MVLVVWGFLFLMFVLLLIPLPPRESIEEPNHEPPLVARATGAPSRSRPRALSGTWQRRFEWKHVRGLFLTNQLEAIEEPNQEAAPEGPHQVPSTSAIRKPGQPVVILMYDKMPLWRVGLSKINSADRIFPTLGWCRSAFCTPPACGPQGVVAWVVLGREISGA